MLPSIILKAGSNLPLTSMTGGLPQLQPAWSGLLPESCSQALAVAYRSVPHGELMWSLPRGLPAA